MGGIFIQNTVKIFTMNMRVTDPYKLNKKWKSIILSPIYNFHNHLERGS
jgi:hypothetical protein